MKSSTGRRTFLATCAMAGAAAARPLAAFGQAVNNAPQASSPSALRITDVKCGYVRGSLFVKIHTNEGIWGCGEAVDAIQGTYHMVQSLGQRLRNQSPLNVHRHFEQLRKGGVFGGAQAGVFIAVLSALETALWDLAGKALNVPVYQLLGGKFRDRIRVYLDTALYQTKQPSPDLFAQSASAAAKMGYTAVKFDLDQGNDPNGFRRMLEMGAVDIIMPDLQKAGGLGEGQRIANLANLYYVPFAPHMVASYLGAMAACHVCASVPNFMILEWQTYFDTQPMYKEIVSYDGPQVEKGFIRVSEKPGIGVEINEDAMRKYATPGVPFFA